MKNSLSEKIKQLVAAAGKLEPGTVTHISIKHEDGCPAIKTQRTTDCTCTKPIITRLFEA